MARYRWKPFPASCATCGNATMTTSFPSDSERQYEKTYMAWPPETDLAGELSLCVAISRDQIHIRFRSKSNRYQPCFMEALADHYCRFLESAAEQPMAALIDLDMTTPEELARLLAWSSGPEASRVPNLYHVRFQEYVDKNPDKEAVVLPRWCSDVWGIGFPREPSGASLPKLGCRS